MRNGLWILLPAFLGACAGAIEVGTASSGGLSGGSSTSSGSGGGTTTSADAGGGSGRNAGAASGGYASGGVGGSGGASNGASSGGLGSLCSAFSDCATGLVCGSGGTCQLPGDLEQCDPNVGCANEPSGLGCYPVNDQGSLVPLCLVPCSGTDSSVCPYGTSCGDPNLEGYCTPTGPGTCTAWSPCGLGSNVVGTCVPSGNGTAVCVATGLGSAFGPCNPDVANDSAADLCGSGMLCIPNAAAPSTLHVSLAALDGGTCFPLCGGNGGPACGSGLHCYQPPGAPFGTCLPGAPCTLGESTCSQVGWWCLPDSLDSPAGGCVSSAPDAAVAGPCSIPQTLDAPCPCGSGQACLPGPDGGLSCQALCGLDAGMGCTDYESCAPIGDAGAVLGVCQ